MKTVQILTEKRICSLLDGCHLDCRTSRSADTINHCPDGRAPASVSSRWQQQPPGFRRRLPLRTSERFNKTERSRVLMPLPSGNNNRSEKQRRGGLGGVTHGPPLEPRRRLRRGGSKRPELIRTFHKIFSR